MVSIPSLWLPILLSAVIVFIASSILHMVLPVHRNDYRGAHGRYLRLALAALIPLRT